jgi:plasmid stabilization system protein ParE
VTSRVIVRPGAERDATESYDYYESLAPGLGARFLDELNRVLGQIAEHPEMYQEVIPGVRRGLIRVFPYGVFYVIDQDAVFVIAIASDLRDPTRWKSRSGK